VRRPVVLVNGSDSFIGRRVISALQQSDWAFPVGIKTGDAEGLRAALPDAHSLANCIVGNPQTLLSSAAALCGGETPLPASLRVVHLSSMTVYGSIEGLVTEQSETRADLGAYSSAQLAAESLIAEQPNSLILRLGVEYGPGCPAWSDRVARWLLARRLGDLGAGGDGLCNLIFIEDLQAIILSALRAKHSDGQIFNVAQPVKPTWNDYFTEFAIALGAVPVRRISARRLRIESKVLAVPLKLAEMGARAARMRDGTVPSPITSSLLRTCRQEISLDTRKLERTFAVNWTPLDTGLKLSAQAFLRR
jgi:2-alkyl-3-oxoalkanoate reductase